jgi:uncharacterized repeat protein (TIGR02543 family)
MVATSTPAWAVPTLADVGTEQVTSTSVDAQTPDDTAAAAETEVAETEVAETEAAETDTATDAADNSAAEENSIEDSEDTVAQSSSSEDVSISLYSSDSEDIVTITFNANQGIRGEGDEDEYNSTTWTEEYTAGGTFGWDEYAYREGYSLLGWSTDKDSATPEYTPENMADATVPADGTTLYAIWVKINVITYDANGGQRDEYDTATTWTEEYTAGSTFGWDEYAYRAGYRLLGWSTNKDTTTPEYTSENMPDASVPADGTTLYAIWVKTSTITFNANGGQRDKGDDEHATAKTWTIEYLADANFEYNALAYRKGNMLLGWSTKQDATEPEYDVHEMYSKPVPADGTTLYAVWVEATTITFDANGGQHYVGDDEDATATTWTEEYIKGTTFGDGVYAYRDSCILEGWSTKKDSATPEYDLQEMADMPVPETDITLYAIWTKIVTITLDGNGGTVGGDKSTTIETSAGNALGSEYYDKTREGYKFLGWSTDKDAEEPEWTDLKGAIFTTDTTLYAVWEDVISLTYDGNGGTIAGSGSTIYSEEVEKNSRHDITVEAERDGYVFLGWSTDKNAQKASYELYSYIDMNDDVHLYAVWAATSSAGYKVTLNLNGATYEDSDTYTMEVAKGKPLGEIEAYFDRDGYSLKGWSLTKNGSVVADDLSTYVPTSNVTLYAVWVKTYTITLENLNNYSSTSKVYTVNEGEYLSDLPDFVNDNYDGPITGWKDKDSGKIYTRDELLTTPVTASHTYVAQTDEDSICKVTIMKNDGSDEKNVIEVTKGIALVQACWRAGFYREGYEQIGWSFDSDADWKNPGDYFTSEGTPSVTEDMTLYCVWAPLCSITYDGNGGHVIGSKETTYTTDKEFCGYTSYEIIGYQDNFVRDGYALAGWSPDPKASEAGEGFTHIINYGTQCLNIAGDTTLYAVWKKGCTITLNYNGGFYSIYTKETTASAQVVSGQTVSDSITISGTQGSREGYVLEGWSTDKDAKTAEITATQMDSYQPSEDETWYAVWKPIKAGSTHTVYFSANGGKINTTYGSPELMEDDSGCWTYIPNNRAVKDVLDQDGFDYGLDFDKDGYYLAGWSKKAGATTADFKTSEELGAFTPTEDTTLYAVWKPLKLTQSETSITLKVGRKHELKISTTPKYEWDGTKIADKAVFSSNSTDVVDVGIDTNEITATHVGKTVVTASVAGQTVHWLVNVVDGDETVIYKTHVQKKGTMDWVEDGALSGTTGQGLRMEALYLDLADAEYPGMIEYRTYVQKLGWQDWSADGAMSGTSGKSLRLEAVQIRLTGEMAEQYDIYYCVHAQHYGWLNWAKNGESSGTAGFGYRLEALRIKLVKKGDAAPAKLGSDTASYHKNTASVTYTSHVQTYGTQKWVSDGAMSGTRYESKRMEAVYIKLASQPFSGNIEYESHIQKNGWETEWKKNGEMSGTSGEKKRLEAIRIRLTGDMAKHYDVYYRVYAQHFGWLGWAKNGANSGTAGYGYRLEGIQIKLVPKGQAAPGSTTNAFRQNNS